MKQRPKPFKQHDSKYFYFYHYDKYGRRKLKSTHRTVKWKAEQFIDDYLTNINEPKQDNVGDLPLREYAEPFFIWDKCRKL